MKEKVSKCWNVLTENTDSLNGWHIWSCCLFEVYRCHDRWILHQRDNCADFQSSYEGHQYFTFKYAKQNIIVWSLCTDQSCQRYIVWCINSRDQGSQIEEHYLYHINHITLNNCMDFYDVRTTTSSKFYIKDFFYSCNNHYLRENV